MSISNYKTIRQLELYNAQGKRIFYKKENVKALEVIRTEHLSTGIYYLTIQFSSSIKTVKLIKI